MADSLLAFFENSTAGITGRTKSFGQIDQAKLPYDLIDAYHRYRKSYLMMAGGALLFFVLLRVETLVVGALIVYVGWKENDKMYKILEAGMKDAPSIPHPGKSFQPLKNPAQGPWIVYAYEISGEEKIFGTFATEEEARLFSDKNSPAEKPLSIRYSPPPSARAEGEWELIVYGAKGEEVERRSFNNEREAHQVREDLQSYFTEHNRPYTIELQKQEK